MQVLVQEGSLRYWIWTTPSDWSSSDLISFWQKLPVVENALYNGTFTGSVKPIDPSEMSDSNPFFVMLDDEPEWSHLSITDGGTEIEDVFGAKTYYHAGAA